MKFVNYFVHFLIQNKASPNNGILLRGVLMPRLLNNHFASCFLKNFGFFRTTYSTL